MSVNAHVGAVVVTYHPELAELASLLDALRPQVERLWLVDNASPAAVVKEVDSLAKKFEAGIITNNRNLGVAVALNQGVAVLRNAGCSHVLLMDQDSVPALDMVATLLGALQEAESAAPVAAVGPVHVDARTGNAAPFIRIGFPFNRKLSPVGKPLRSDFLITSGSLLPVDVLGEVGGMDDGLFIDNVDLDWCFRARARGYQLLGVPAARMRHHIGDRLQWRPGGHAIVHGPTRLYFIMRNRLLLYRKPQTPWRWIAQDLPRALLKFGGFALAVSPRLRNMRAMLRGIRDGIAGRSGPAPTSP